MTQSTPEIDPQTLANFASGHFLSIFQSLKQRGNFSSPRGQLIFEAENFLYSLPPYVRFCSFPERRLKISYVKQEFLWYLKGDPKDLSIVEKASMWKGLVTPHGTINSNYGQYMFGEQDQFSRVVEELKRDKDSRRASILILSERHTAEKDTKDLPCTYSLNFRIRNNQLNMTVHMRSQDAVFGMGNDAPAFSFVHEMVYNALLPSYSELSYGMYWHFADSFHVYKRHFDVFGKLANWAYNGDDEKPGCYSVTEYDVDQQPVQRLCTPVLCPKISGPEEVDFLRTKVWNGVVPPPEFRFSRWLTEVDGG